MTKKEKGPRQELTAIQQEIDRLSKERDLLIKQTEAEILEKARALYEGKYLYRGEEYGYARVDHVVSVELSDFGQGPGNVIIRFSGATLREAWSGNGFKLKRKRYYHYTHSKSQPGGFAMSPDGTLSEKGARVITQEEWKTEVSRNNRLEKWLVDATGAPVTNHGSVVYIRDGKLIVRNVHGFDEDTGLFKILYDSLEAPDGSYQHVMDERPGSELVQLVIKER